MRIKQIIMIICVVLYSLHTTAQNLIVAPSTVRRHIENIYHKLQVHSKTEAIALARKKRLI